MTDSTIFKIYTVTMSKKYLDVLKPGLCKLQGQIQEKKEHLLACLSRKEKICFEDKEWLCSVFGPSKIYIWCRWPILHVNLRPFWQGLGSRHILRKLLLDFWTYASVRNTLLGLHTVTIIYKYMVPVIRYGPIAIRFLLHTLTVRVLVWFATNMAINLMAVYGDLRYMVYVTTHVISTKWSTNIFDCSLNRALTLLHVIQSPEKIRPPNLE